MKKIIYILLIMVLSLSCEQQAEVTKGKNGKSLQKKTQSQKEIIASLGVELGEKKKVNAKQAKEIINLKLQIKAINFQWEKNKNEIIPEFEDKLRVARAELRNLRNASQEEISQKEKVIRDHENMIAFLKGLQKTLKEDLAFIQGELARAEGKTVIAATKLTAASTELSRLQAKYAQMEKFAIQYGKIVAQRDAEIEQLKASRALAGLTIEHKDSEIVTMRTKLVQLKKELAKSQEDLVDTLDGLEDTIKKADASNAALKEALAKVDASNDILEQALSNTKQASRAARFRHDNVLSVMREDSIASKVAKWINTDPRSMAQGKWTAKVYPSHETPILIVRADGTQEYMTRQDYEGWIVRIVVYSLNDSKVLPWGAEVYDVRRHGEVAGDPNSESSPLVARRDADNSLNRISKRDYDRYLESAFRKI